MSNIVKSFFINRGEEKRVIDYNDLILEKLRLAEQNNHFQSAENLLGEYGANGADIVEDGFTPGLDAEILELPQDELESFRAENERARAVADDIIAQANQESERILRKAKKDADAMWENAYAEAKNAGFDAGTKDGRAEIDRMRNELLKEKKKQQEEYVEMLENMERDLVDIMIEVFEKVTKALSVDKKDIILHLIENALNHIESSREFVIRVSADDYQFVERHKEFLTQAILQGGSLELVKDVTLERNQCLIETDGGIFDCSLDVQLENLIMDIKALSCM